MRMRPILNKLSLENYYYLPTFQVSDGILSEVIRCEKEGAVKGLIKLAILLAVVFCVSAVFKGGDYVRLISSKTGINLHSAADLADSFRLDTFMAQKKGQERQKENRVLGN